MILDGTLVEEETTNNFNPSDENGTKNEQNFIPDGGNVEDRLKSEQENGSVDLENDYSADFHEMMTVSSCDTNLFLFP